MEISKKIAAKENNLTYNKGGDCSKLFMEDKIFPELEDSTTIKNYVVPVLYRIKENGTVYDVAIEQDHQRTNIFPSHHYTTLPKFERESIRLMNQSGKWNPFNYNGNYVNREGRMFVTFEYHPEYFTNKRGGLILNPDVKAKFIGDQELFDNLVLGKNGADGIVTFLVIVEKDGTLSNEYCLNSVGKTNCEIGLHNLKKLSSWKPAVKNGQIIRSQLKISIST